MRLQKPLLMNTIKFLKKNREILEKSRIFFMLYSYLFIGDNDGNEYGIYN